LNGVGGTFGGDGNNTITLTSTDFRGLGVASTVMGTSASSDTITGAPGSTGALVYKDGGGTALINPTAGNVTVFGGSGGTQTVFGGSTPFTGSLTVVKGTGLFVGGTAGNNLIGASTVGGSTLIGGGANDTLRAGGQGDILVGGGGLSTLDGSGSAGGDILVASSSAPTYMFGSRSVGDVFFFSNSTVSGVGFKGSFIAAHTSPNGTIDNLNNNVSNTFAIGSGAEFGTVYDFISGVDKVSISGAQGSVNIISPTVTGGQYVLYTSTGTTIAFLTKISSSDIVRTS
jgi:hypothetical protein